MEHARRRGSSCALRRHRRRADVEDGSAEPPDGRSFRAAFTALSVSVLSILLAAVAIFLSVTRQPAVGPGEPAPPAPATVTMTLLAPTASDAPKR